MVESAEGLSKNLYDIDGVSRVVMIKARDAAIRKEVAEECAKIAESVETVDYKIRCGANAIAKYIRSKFGIEEGV